MGEDARVDGDAAAPVDGDAAAPVEGSVDVKSAPYAKHTASRTS
jgi:hypothetical protein